MLRRRLGCLGVSAAILVVALIAGLWALPEIIRRVAEKQILVVLDRRGTIEDIDLNLFTGRFALKRLRIAERADPEAFVTLERLDAWAWLPSLLFGEIRLREITLTAPGVRLVRTGPTEFNVSDLIEKFTRGETKKTGPTWIFTLDGLALRRGQLVLQDRAVTPAADWSVGDLEIAMTGFSTDPKRAPAKGEVTARLGTAELAVRAPSFALSPLESRPTVALRNFDLARLKPYLPPDLPFQLDSGVLTVELELDARRSAEGVVERAAASGQVTLTGLSVRDATAASAFFTMPRLGVRIDKADLQTRRVVVGAIELSGLEVRAAREPDGELDLVRAYRGWAERRAAAASGGAPSAGNPPASAPPAPAPSAEPAPPGPPPWVVVLERVVLEGLRVVLADRAVSPAREWRLEGLGLTASGLSTAPEDPPGTLQLSTKIAVTPGPAAPASLAADLGAVRAQPLEAKGRVTLSGFDVTTVTPYVPLVVPATATRGTLAADLTATVARDTGAVDFQALSVVGMLRLADLAVTQRGAADPFLATRRLEVGLRGVDAVARRLALGTVQIEAPKVRAVRDPEGQIDLLALAPKSEPAPGAPAASTPAPAPARAPAGAAPAPARAAAPAPPAQAPFSVSLDRLALTGGTVTFDDRATAPATTLELTNLSVTAETVSWPSRGPARLVLGVTMPGGGRTDIEARLASLDPIDMQIVSKTRDAPITPYGAYFPFRARFAGLFSGDSVNEIKRDGDVLLAASRGTGWATDLEVRDPDLPSPVAKMARMEIRGIDFSWPNFALIDRITLSSPSVEVIRNEQGVINLQRLFDPRQAAGTEAPPATDAAKPEAPKPDASKPEAPGDAPKPGIVLDFREITLEDGYVRFLDRTTTPVFSQDMAKLRIVVKDLSNILGRNKTTVLAQALVNGEAALDLRGETSGIGETLVADLVGEIRDYPLSSANPYADQLTSWVIQRGKLEAKVHYRVEGDRITAMHNVDFKGLRVERARESDEAKRKLGVPLGLAVSLLKDRRGNIDFEIPISGTLSDRKFDWGEAMWAGVKQVLGKVLLAPFSAIGRLFSSEEKEPDLSVNPLGFGAGSAVVGPSAEIHLTRVADFLRRSPYIKMTLTPVVTGTDAEGLRVAALTERIRKFQEEKKIAEFPAALAAYYAAQKLPGEVPKTDDEKLARLVEREPVPTDRAREVAERRVAAARDLLTGKEGVLGERLSAAQPKLELDKPGEGRVEFGIIEAEGNE